MVFGYCFAVSSAPAGVPEVRDYQVNFTDTPIGADGIVDAAWSNAEGAAGDWRRLRETIADTDGHNNRFQMMWDDDNLYLLFQSDYTSWRSHPGFNTIDFAADNLSLFFDPDTNDDGNFPPENGQFNPFTTPDGYQITFNMYNPHSAHSGCVFLDFPVVASESL